MEESLFLPDPSGLECCLSVIPRDQERIIRTHFEGISVSLGSLGFRKLFISHPSGSRTDNRNLLWRNSVYPGYLGFVCGSESVDPSGLECCFSLILRDQERIIGSHFGGILFIPSPWGFCGSESVDVWQMIYQIMDDAKRSKIFLKLISFYRQED